MSDQPQDVTAGKQPVCSPEPPPTQDSSPKDASPGADADAALARAVAAAERAAGAARRDSARPGVSPAPAKVEASRATSAAPRPALRRAAAAVLALAGLGGAAAGGYGFALHRPADPALLAAIAGLQQGQADIVRLTGDVKSLKVAVEALKDNVDRARLDAVQRQAQILDRIERAEKAPHDFAVRVTSLGEQLGRIEAVAKEPGVQLATLSERLDRIERQVAASAKPAAPAAAAASPAPEPAAQTGAVAKETAKEPSKEPLKEAAVEGWVLREVYDGVALIEGRNRRLVEVGPGEQVPGVGRVEAIERRGRRWVVVTAKGLIAMPR
jgi:hypothetical protein